MIALAVAPALFFSACGGSSSSTGTHTPPPTTYTIGGTISGLSGSGLVLQNNGGNNLQVSSTQTTFTFTTAVASGAAYAVTVLTQPSAQTCSVTNGSGTATANITNVQITCVSGYAIGGTVSGLSGAGLVLQDNGGDNLTIASNGGFTFATTVAIGGAYAVTVLTQPSNPLQTCTVTNGSGTANADITSVQVTCTNNNAAAWGWINGANTIDPTGTYGAQGIAAPGNVPGGRDSAVSWIDSSGNFWLFGGNGHDTTSSTGSLNDMWMYSTSSGEWTWVSGADSVNQIGSYGTLGTASATNIPGARDSATFWIDASGDLWVFGGHGFDSIGTEGLLNDLWKYSAGQWTWMSGSNLAGQTGVYGTQGTAASSNIPGGRNSGAAWVDASGSLWLFGGHGFDSTGTNGLLNDFWKYSAGLWTWVGGSNTFGSSGVYGTLGAAASTNIPGARNDGSAWVDAAGNFWLFGGRGLDSTGSGFDLNDLWKYTGGQWTWVGGADVSNQPGIYGTLGTAAAANVPGSRNGAALWMDKAGNVWLFGGAGFDSGGAGGELSDLWVYSAGEWTWMGGSNLVNQLGIYGTLGTLAQGNLPGSRNNPALWIDASGNAWLFGGYGHDGVHGSNGELNDLWEYQP
jgi:N-acetylneuraminic acid mutarotase